MLELPLLKWLLHFSNNVVLIGANLLVQSTILILIGLCFAYVYRKRGVVVQSLILRSFLVAVLICPFVSILISFAGFNGIIFDIPMESFVYSETAGSSPQTMQKGFVTNDGVIPYQTSPGESNKPEYDGLLHQYFGDLFFSGDNGSNLYLKGRNETHSPFMNWRAILYIAFMLIWVSVSIFFLIRFIVQFQHIMYIRRTAFDAESAVIKESKAIAYQLGIEVPLILKSSMVESPFLTGINKPAILLPKDLTPTKEILLHELAHQVRRDCLWNLLSYIGIALLPLQPLMKVLSRQIEETGDYVCDNFVIKYVKNPGSYASLLVDLAERFQPYMSDKLFIAGIISVKSSLRRRVERILEDSSHFFITVKAGILVNILLICLGATVLTGFISFREKRIVPGNNSYISLSDKVESYGSLLSFTDKKQILKPSDKKEFSKVTPLYNELNSELKTSIKSESKKNKIEPEMNALANFRKVGAQDNHAVTITSKQHIPDSPGIEEHSLNTPLNNEPVTNVKTLLKNETPKIVTESWENVNENLTSKDINNNHDVTIDAKKHLSKSSDIEEFLLNTRLNVAMSKKTKLSVKNKSEKSEKEQSQDLHKLNPYNSDKSFSWEVILSNKE